MELQLKIIGIVSLLLGFIHLFFPKQFGWKDDLRSLTLINRQLMYVHTFFIAFAVFLAGVLCLLYADDIVNTPLGHAVTLGFGIFWATRLFFQFFVYSSELWKGKRFETTVHVLFSMLWAYFSVVFFCVSFR